MEIQCKCGSWDTYPIRNEKTQHETGNFRCRKCGLRFVPRDTVRTDTVDLIERMEVLDVQRRTLQGRLTAVSLPNEMIAHAEHLEREAEKIFDRAQAIRRTLADDTVNVTSLLQKLHAVELEISACRYCIAARIRPTKGMLQQVVESYLKGKNHDVPNQ